MVELSIEIKTKSYQRLCKELGIPEDEIWVEDLEHGLEIVVEPQSIRTADWESLVSLTFTVISGMPPLVVVAKWLYERLKRSQVADEITITRREKVPFTEDILLKLLKEVKENHQSQIRNEPTLLSPTIPEQIQQLAVLHTTGALTEVVY